VRFASLQGEVAKEVFGRHPELQGVDSMLWVRPAAGAAPEQVEARSDAVLAAGRYLGGVWGALAALARLVPRPLRDWGYDRFARIRRRVPGMTEACTLPTPEESARFLDR
jgi:predicted DCC family thiol-disulfide oxidoreductase YuxK